MATAGELYRLARVLRAVALAATTDPGEERPSLAVVTVTEDIARHDPTTVGEIAARTGLAQSLVSTTVSDLREAGVLATRVDAADRRRTRISIARSARTEVFATRAARGVGDALREALPDLPDRRLARVEALIDGLVAEVDGRPAAG